MHRPTSLELTVLGLGLILIFAGIIIAIDPHETNLPMEATHKDHHPAIIEHLSKKESQLYGVLAVVVGICLVIAALPRQKE
jgi:uncharacterized membrane protein HdeD (DUF308 family)